MVSEGKYIEYSWVLISVFARLVVSKGMYMEIAIFCLQVRNKVSPRHLTPCAVAEPPNPLYKVACPGYPWKNTIDVGGPLYARSRAENASINWPGRATPLRKTQSMLVGPRSTRSPAKSTSIKWPVQVTPLKKPNRCWLDRSAPGQRTPLQSAGLHPWERPNRCWLGHFIYPLPSRERLYKVACPGYTPERTPISVGWTTLYPLPSRERLYKVACPGCTPRRNINRSWLDHFIYFQPLPSLRNSKRCCHIKSMTSCWI